MMMCGFQLDKLEDSAISVEIPMLKVNGFPGNFGNVKDSVKYVYILIIGSLLHYFFMPLYPGSHIRKTAICQF